MKWLLVVLLLLPLTDLTAQGTPSITPGARVRITLPSRFYQQYQQREEFIYYPLFGTPRVVGSIVELNADTLLLRVEGRGSPVAIPLASVTRMEVRTNFRGTHALKGAGIGFLLGIGIGSAYIRITSFPTINPSKDDAGLARLWARIGILGLSGGVGAGIGARIGALVGVEQWKWMSILLPLRVGLLPQGGRYFAVRFKLGK